MTGALTADVVIIGSGSAGSVVAARLAADPDCEVIVVEAGGSDRNPLLHVPLMSGTLLRGRYANWCYETEPVPALGGRRLAWPRGKVVGGSSTINGMVWTRGLPADYDGWAQKGLPDWTAARVWAAYQALEGVGPGSQPVTDPPPLHPLAETFLEAGHQAGFPVSGGFDSPAPEGFGRYRFTIRGGRRASAARSLLQPMLGRPNVTLLTRTLARRIVVEQGRAVAVEVAHDGRAVQLRARHQIVLCGGTVNSPQLLMLSGIGPADALRAHGLPVTADLPGVGANLIDHLLVRVEHACREPVTLHGLLRPDRTALALIRALLFGTGPAARFPLEAGAYLRSDPALDMPDLQSFFLPALSTATLRLPFGPRAGIGHGFFANVYPLRPESRGRITLRSADPQDPPCIEPGYLTADTDLAATLRGVRLLRTVFAQPAFDRWRGIELAPGPDIASDAEIAAWIRQSAAPVFHPIGTCRMGNDPASVVDGRLRVRGIEGLRVADASVMPAMPSGNTQAPAMMIGAQAAAFIAEELAGETADAA